MPHNERLEAAETHLTVADFARRIRYACTALGVNMDPCLPGEAHPCGADELTHVANWLGMLRALAADLTSILPADLRAECELSAMAYSKFIEAQRDRQEDT